MTPKGTFIFFRSLPLVFLVCLGCAWSCLRASALCLAVRRHQSSSVASERRRRDDTAATAARTSSTFWKATEPPGRRTA
jgi:hypothetical protein